MKFFDASNEEMEPFINDILWLKIVSAIMEGLN